MPRKKKEEIGFDDLFSELEEYAVEEVVKVRAGGPRKFINTETGEEITRKEYEALPPEEKAKFVPVSSVRKTKRVDPRETIEAYRKKYEKVQSLIKAVRAKAKKIPVRNKEGEVIGEMKSFCVDKDAMVRILEKYGLHSFKKARKQYGDDIPAKVVVAALRGVLGAGGYVAKEDVHMSGDVICIDPEIKQAPPAGLGLPKNYEWVERVVSAKRINWGSAKGKFKVSGDRLINAVYSVIGKKTK